VEEVRFVLELIAPGRHLAELPDYLSLALTLFARAAEGLSNPNASSLNRFLSLSGMLSSA